MSANDDNNKDGGAGELSSPQVHARGGVDRHSGGGPSIGHHRRSGSGRPRTQIEGMDALQRYEESQTANGGVPPGEDDMTEAERQMRDEEISFYSNSENEFGDDNIWGLLSGVGGNIYEWYVRFRVRHQLDPPLAFDFLSRAANFFGRRESVMCYCA